MPLTSQLPLCGGSSRGGTSFVVAKSNHTQALIQISLFFLLASASPGVGIKSCQPGLSTGDGRRGFASISGGRRGFSVTRVSGRCRGFSLICVPGRVFGFVVTFAFDDL